MKTNVFIIAAISGFVAVAANAQVTAFANDGAADTAVEDIEDAISDAAERDIGRFGNEGRQIGSYGSLSLRGTSTSNDGETSSDVGVGLRYGTFDGKNGIDVTAAFTASELPRLSLTPLTSVLCMTPRAFTTTG